MINLIVLISILRPFLGLWTERLWTSKPSETRWSRMYPLRVTLLLSRTISFGMFACAGGPHAAAVAAERFLSPDQMISALADGVPWVMNTSDGMQANLTLRKDGTGIFEGPFSGPSAWNISGDDMCLIIKMPVPMTNRKCFRVARITGGYRGYENGKPAFTLNR